MWTGVESRRMLESTWKEAGEMLPKSLIKAEHALAEAEDELAFVMAHGTADEKRAARDAWQEAKQLVLQEAGIDAVADLAAGRA